MYFLGLKFGMASKVFFLGCCCAESQEHMKQTATELTEDLTRAEMLEHLQFIKKLPHKYSHS